MAKTEVPAETFPVRSAMLLVATIPVPASPSGGQSGMPAGSSPVGSISLAPSPVSVPAVRSSSFLTILGIGVACLVLLVIIAGLIAFLLIRRNNRRQQ